MKERPILFNGAMVRALLDGRKTQTRRVCKREVYSNGFHFDGHEILCHDDYLPPSAMLMNVQRGKISYTTSNLEGWETECPYGIPGDRLWVREAWRTTGDDGRCDGMPPRDLQPHEVWYDADGAAPSDLCVGKCRPSMFMPRWASRITLAITDVRVDRLQEISEADAIAEGCESNSINPRGWFGELWDSLNAERGFGWDTSPWVWVVEFRRLP